MLTSKGVSTNFRVMAGGKNRCRMSREEAAALMLDACQKPEDEFGATFDIHITLWKSCPKTGVCNLILMIQYILAY